MRWIPNKPTRCRRTDVWCPVCRGLEMRQTLLLGDWKCRACGSRIRNETLGELVVDRILRFQLEAEDPDYADAGEG